MFFINDPAVCNLILFIRPRSEAAYIDRKPRKNDSCSKGGTFIALATHRRELMTQPQAEFLDLYRAGLKTAADMMKVSLQSAERLQNQQLVAIRTALDQQSKSISELSQARTLDEVLALQTKIAGAQIERAMGYWNELCQTQMAQARDWFNETYTAGTQAANNAQAVMRSAAKHQQEQHRKSA
jgi:phasin family protein